MLMFLLQHSRCFFPNQEYLDTFLLLAIISFGVFLLNNIATKDKISFTKKTLFLCSLCSLKGKSLFLEVCNKTWKYFALRKERDIWPSFCKLIFLLVRSYTSVKTCYVSYWQVLMQNVFEKGICHYHVMHTNLGMATFISKSKTTSKRNSSFIISVS